MVRHALLSRRLFDFGGSVLFNEFFGTYVTTANFDVDLVVGCELSVHSPGAKSIDAFCLSYEHDFQEVAIWKLIDELGELLIQQILLLANIDRLILLLALQHLIHLLQTAIFLLQILKFKLVVLYFVIQIMHIPRVLLLLLCKITDLLL